MIIIQYTRHKKASKPPQKPNKKASPKRILIPLHRNGTSVRPNDSTSDSHSEEATELAGRDEVTSGNPPTRPWALGMFESFVGNKNAAWLILCVFFFESESIFLGGRGGGKACCLVLY